MKKPIAALTTAVLLGVPVAAGTAAAEEMTARYEGAGSAQTALEHRIANATTNGDGGGGYGGGKPRPYPPGADPFVLTSLS
ncbi:MAG: hypothetical protein AAGF73_14360 [Actinomycetota bacterium]